MRLLHDVVTKWYEIGLELGFPDADLEIIRTNLTPGGVVSMFREMLRLWLRWAPPAHSCPTIGALCKALQGPSVSNERLAAQLEERFKSQQEGSWFHNYFVDLILLTLIILYTIQVVKIS